MLTIRGTPLAEIMFQQLVLQRVDEDCVFYSLYGAVLHSGSLASGHYTALVKKSARQNPRTMQFLQRNFVNRDDLGRKETLTEKHKDLRDCTSTRELNKPVSDPDAKDFKWFEISDLSVHDTCVKSVIDQLSTNAYLLFYERISNQNTN